MLDVLITLNPKPNAAWLTQCRTSVADAVSRAGFAVRVAEIPGVPGHIGQAMVNGLDASSALYVAWVDDDDYVLPRAFACLAPYFAVKPRAICAREIQLGARGQQVPQMRRHHLTVWRRDVLLKWRKEIGACVAGLTSTKSAQALLEDPVARGVVDVLEHVYVWRRYLSGGMALRNQVKRESA